MIVQCEKCLTKFRLDVEKIPEKGGKARCSKCKNIFEIAPPTITPEPEKDINVIEKDAPVRKKRFLLKGLIVLFALVLLVAGMFLLRDKLTDTNWKGFNFPSDTNKPHDKDIVFSTSQTQGYYIDNTKIGKIFVIDGNAINNSSEAKSFIRVKGALFDSTGNSIAEREAYCGNILSKDELAELEADKIDLRIDYPAGESSINLNVSPGKSIPFMIVFFDLPEDLKEFSVESTGAKKAAK